MRQAATQAKRVLAQLTPRELNCNLISDHLHFMVWDKGITNHIGSK